jgi:hypothetical protein
MSLTIQLSRRCNLVWYQEYGMKDNNFVHFGGNYNEFSIQHNG